MGTDVLPEGETPYVVEWTSPSDGPNGSMPLGNGDIGVNAWVEANGDLLFYIAKSDAWSENARLLKLGRVRVSFEPPLETAAAFRQTLDVREGCMTVRTGVGESAPLLRLWVDANWPAVRVTLDDDATPRTMHVALEVWRTAPRALAEGEIFSAYGLKGSPDPVVCEADTIVDEAGDRLLWYHRNERSLWADNLRRQDMASWVDQGKDPLLGRTFGGLIAGAGLVRRSPTELVSAEPVTHHAASVYCLTGQTQNAEEWRTAILLLNDNDHFSQAFAPHRAWWRAFQERSYIHVASASGKDLAHINRGYALQRYIGACAGRGAFPIKFNGSLFTVDATEKDATYDADYRRWGGPYWFQNTRLVYWPMLAAGDFDTMRPFFRMYLDALPFARARTQEYFGHDGAFFPETMYFWGAYAQENYGWQRGDLPKGVTENCYIRYHYDGALELLAIMLDYYAFTGDAAFVEDALLPLAEAAPRFFFAHYPPDASGKMHIAPSQALETWQKAVNPLPPIAGLEWVLDGLLALPGELVPAALRKEWQGIRAALPPLPRTGADGEVVLAAASEILEEARNSETPELYAIFPYRLFGVGKPELELARRTFTQRKVKGNEGWRQDDTQAALLGLTDEAAGRLSNRLSRSHPGSRFPAFWGPNFDWIPDQDHGGNAMMALQTMLLQYDGAKMYLLPAWPKDWDAAFRLHAPGGTVIEAVYRAGALERLEVTPAERKADVVVMLAE